MKIAWSPSVASFLSSEFGVSWSNDSQLLIVNDRPQRLVVHHVSSVMDSLTDDDDDVGDNSSVGVVAGLRQGWILSLDEMAASSSLGSGHSNDDLSTAVDERSDELFCGIHCFAYEKKTEPLWTHELVCVSYAGDVYHVLINWKTRTHLVSFFSDVLRQALDSGMIGRFVSQSAFLNRSRLLLIGSHQSASPTGAGDRSSASSLGLTLWKLYDSSWPYLKSVDEREFIHSAGWFSWAFPHRKFTNDVCVQLAVSPNQLFVCSVHSNSAVSLWALPSLAHKAYWAPNELPYYDDFNQDILEKPRLRRRYGSLAKDHRIVSVCWWNDDAIVVLRRNGALTVFQLVDLSSQDFAGELNLLIGSGGPEFFLANSSLAKLSLRSGAGHGFLVLQPDLNATIERLDRSSHIGDDDYDDEELEPLLTLVGQKQRLRRWLGTSISFLRRLRHKQALTDRQTPSSSSLESCSFRLSCLQSTTPEKLFKHKLKCAEYGEALQLARSYGLNTDAVFQEQWRMASPVSVASISDFLGKVRDRHWVLRECLNRVPRSPRVCQELISFGLSGTDLPVLLAVKDRSASGLPFLVTDQYLIDCGIIEADELPAAVLSKNELYAHDLDQLLERRRRERSDKLIQRLDLDKLSLEQKELVKIRLKLLQYRDRLNIYEQILAANGSQSAIENSFDPAFFEQFRAQDVVEAAVQFARAADFVSLKQVVELSTTCSNKLLEILSAIPETLSPGDYRSFLPWLEEHDENVYWMIDSLAGETLDWCQCGQVLASIDLEQLGDFTLEVKWSSQPTTMESTRPPQSFEQVSRWLSERAETIDQRSGRLDYAVELLSIADKQGFTNLRPVLNDFTALLTLAYRSGSGQTLAYQQLRQMSCRDVVEMMFGFDVDGRIVFDGDDFLSVLTTSVLPYLERCEQFENQLSHFVFLSSFLYDYCSQSGFIEHILLSLLSVSLPEVADRIFYEEVEVVEFSLDCIAMTDVTQLGASEKALYQIWPLYISLSSRDDEKSATAVRRFHVTRSLVDAALKFAGWGYSVTIKTLLETYETSDSVRSLFNQVVRTYCCRNLNAPNNNYLDVLKDLLRLQNDIFNSVHPSVCYEAFFRGMLGSGSELMAEVAIDLLRSGVYGRGKAPMPVPTMDIGQIEKICLEVGVEYFNSAASLSDPCMKFAQRVLRLVEPPSEPVKNQLDLIEAISIIERLQRDSSPVERLYSGLQSFCLPGSTTTSSKSHEIWVPLKVSLTKNRMEIIEQLLAADPSLYRHHSSLVELAELLHVSQDDVGGESAEGVVLRRCLQLALGCSDVALSRDLCSRLISRNVGSAWPFIHSFAIDFAAKLSLETRVQLMEFCLRHCHPDYIRSCLASRVELDCKANCDVETPARHYMDTTLTRFVTDTDDDDDYVDASTKLIQYRKLRPVLSLLAASIRAGDASANVLHGKALAKLFGLIRHTDTALATQLLLYITDLDVVQRCLGDPDTLDGLLTVCCVYAMRLCACRSFETLFNDSGLANFAEILNAGGISPANFVAAAQDLIEKIGDVKHCSNTRCLTAVERFHKSRLMWMDFVQAESIRRLGLEVDLSRFALDAHYKNSIVLSLAAEVELESVNSAKFSLANELATRYNIASWRVCLEQVSALFASNRLTVEQLRARFDRHRLIDVLRRAVKSETDIDPAKSITEHFQFIYNQQLDGTNLKKVTFYLQTRHSLGIGMISTMETNQLSFESHMALLKRLRSAGCSGIDYKQLTASEASERLDAMIPVAYVSNVHVLGKMASKLGFSASQLFARFALKQFWLDFEKNADVVGAFASVMNEYVRPKVSSESDLFVFMNGLLNSDRLIERTVIADRLRLLNILKSYATSSKWNNALAQIDLWRRLLNALAESDIANWFSTTTATVTTTDETNETDGWDVDDADFEDASEVDSASNNLALKTFGRRLDRLVMSADWHGVHQLLVEMSCTRNVRPTNVASVLRVISQLPLRQDAPNPADWLNSVDEVYSDALKQILENSSIEKLNVLFSNIGATAEESDGQLVIGLLQRLQQFIDDFLDETVDADQLFVSSVLNVLDQKRYKTTENERLKVAVNAAVQLNNSNQFGEKPFSYRQFMEPTAAQAAFERSIGLARSTSAFKLIKALLTRHFKAEYLSNRNELEYRLYSAITNRCGADLHSDDDDESTVTCSDVLSLASPIGHLTSKQHRQLFDVMGRSCCAELACTFALRHNLRQLDDEVVSRALNSRNFLSKPNKQQLDVIFTELCGLMLQSGLMCTLVGSSAFSNVVRFLLDECTDEVKANSGRSAVGRIHVGEMKVRALASELTAAGQRDEADKLMRDFAAATRPDSGLTGVAMSYMKKWWGSGGAGSS